MRQLLARAVWQVANLKDRLTQQRAQGMVEYALIIALVAIALVVAVTAISGGPKNVFNSITNTLSTN
jgi:pilus assembly protein Flp/PilA